MTAVERLKARVGYKGIDLKQIEKHTKEAVRMTHEEIVASRTFDEFSYHDLLAQVDAGTYRGTYVYDGGWEQLRKDLAAGVVK